MSYAPGIDTAAIRQWVAEKLEPSAVEEKLKAQGLDAEAIAVHIKEFRRLRNSKKLSSGFIYLATGAVLGFVSTVLTVFNPVPGLINYILYGLTSIAVLIIFRGLYLIFE